jgi:hypothetical protein
MPLYTSAYLKQVAAGKSSVIKDKLFTESKKTHTSFDIFLCHSFLDKDEVEGIYYELTKQGLSVYVDWIIDPQLNRNNITKESAELIRNRLKISKSLMLAISINAGMSKWMPWELGYMDGHTNQCAIFPVSKDITAPLTFKRAEYLLLYPYIKRAALTSYTAEAIITESANNYVSLNDWSKRNARPSYNLKNIDLL